MKAVKGKFFSRGVHLQGRKSLSETQAVETLEGVTEVAIALSQHIGKPALPVVEVGQAVKRGQLIAKADGFISANVHASIAGIVKAVEQRPDGKGGKSTYVVIERAETDETDFMPPLENPTAEEIVERVAAAGIVGMGGAGFPTNVKLMPRSKVDTLVLNGAECEPYLTCDHRLMVEQTEKIVRGAKYVATALGIEKIVIGIEVNKPDAIALFEQTDLDVCALKKQYPMGSEKHLIYCATGRKVPLGKLPADAGVIVQNVGTVLAVCEAVEEGKPLIERVVTVSGTGIEQPRNLLCPVGAPLSALAEQCGGVKEDAVKYVAGGPMTGNALVGLTSYVSKTSSGYLFLSAKETNTYEPTPCINCGKCADVCPMSLMPMQTEFYTNAGDYQKADVYGGVLSCIECGACTYICPARRPLAQAIKTAKAELRKSK
ncbi:MAG: electron transport complex subunit RsxC [Clostridia bacterium]|nr:electron transport complex subunit RsxC [Clostridia bacterium]